MGRRAQSRRSRLPALLLRLSNIKLMCLRQQSEAVAGAIGRATDSGKHHLAADFAFDLESGADDLRVARAVEGESRGTAVDSRTTSSVGSVT